jgi:hypothetical protein
LLRSGLRQKSGPEVRLTIELKQGILANSIYALAEMLRSGLRQKSGSEVRLTIELKQGLLAKSTTFWPSCYVVDFARSPAHD